MPEVPAVPGTPGLKRAVDAAFADDGPLVRAVDQFEPRAGQRAMAAAVADTLEHGGVLLAEAGTGTGKTLAYLVPAILSRQRVLISTGTKNLQEQIYFKDIPALRDGARRAVHRDLHEGPRQLSVPAPARSAARASRRRRWISSRRSTSGGAAPTPATARSSAGSKKTRRCGTTCRRSAETCLGNDCPQYRECYVTKMRQRAAESDLVIVNHHLLCADASVRQSTYGEVIPDCHYAIIDEAHHLEDVATQYFGIAVSNYRVSDLVRDAERAAESRDDRGLRFGSAPRRSRASTITR